MALKVKAVERKIKFTKDENDPGVWRYVMLPELYIALTQAKVSQDSNSYIRINNRRIVWWFRLLFVSLHIKYGV